MFSVSPDEYAASEVVTQLDTEGDTQRAFFVADVLDPAPKNDVVSMEHPIFALRAGDMQVRRYEHNGHTLTVLPGATGCATIHDKDLWIYCISQLIEAANRGRDIAPTVRFTAFDFLKITQRDTSGRAYERMIEMLRRLKGTVIETSLETGGLRARRGFGLIESWRVVEQSQDVTRMVVVEVGLPKWLFRSVQEKRVLTLLSAYFRLRKPLERRIYELARKHCGRQPLWRVSLTVLHQKSGSISALRRFRFEMKALAESGNLLDYSMSLDSELDQLTFYASSPKGQLAKMKDTFLGKSHVSLSTHHGKTKQSQRALRRI